MRLDAMAFGVYVYNCYIIFMDYYLYENDMPFFASSE
jgi:hypothetical protein